VGQLFLYQSKAIVAESVLCLFSSPPLSVSLFLSLSLSRTQIEMHREVYFDSPPGLWLSLSPCSLPRGVFLALYLSLSHTHNCWLSETLPSSTWLLIVNHRTRLRAPRSRVSESRYNGHVSFIAHFSTFKVSFLHSRSLFYMAGSILT